jgi:hypothetical protein
VIIIMQTKYEWILRVSLMMFIMIPIWAMLLRLFYIRRKWQFMEHLIFSFHIHSFIFFVWGLVMAFSSVGHLVVRMWTMLAILTVYIYLAFYKVYEQGFIKTFFKMFLSFFVYIIVLSLVLTFGLMLSLLIL